MSRARPRVGIDARKLSDFGIGSYVRNLVESIARRPEAEAYAFRVYVRAADRLQRTAAWLLEIEDGLGHVRGVVLADSLGIAADLDAAMATHVEHYVDEWRAISTTGQAAPVRLVRQRARAERSQLRLRRRARSAPTGDAGGAGSRRGRR